MTEIVSTHKKWAFFPLFRRHRTHFNWRLALFFPSLFYFSCVVAKWFNSLIQFEHFSVCREKQVTRSSKTRLMTWLLSRPSFNKSSLLSTVQLIREISTRPFWGGSSPLFRDFGKSLTWIEDDTTHLAGEGSGDNTRAHAF